MDDLIKENFAIVFPIFFASLWFIVTTVLGAMSGWYQLMTCYPDREDPPLLRLRGNSGSMGFGVGMSHILTLSVCETGMRVGMFRLFGPFARDFFVPWDKITVHRKTWLTMPFAELTFGNPSVGRLTVEAHLADRLARAAQGKWPEPGPFPPVTPQKAFSDIFRQWALMTTFAAAFFIVVPRIAAEPGHPIPGPPIIVAVLFPAIVIGIVSFFRYWNRTRR